jgi:hypothetical protein
LLELNESGDEPSISTKFRTRPIEAVPDDAQVEPDEGAWLNAAATLEQHCDRPAEMLPFTIDPVTRYESEDLLERFYEYLRRPVAQAVRSLEEALARGPALPQQRSLERIVRKFSRTMAVLALIGEGYTQEEVARQVGLSRNQVKYVVESIKERYARFAAGPPWEPETQVTLKGVSDGF